MFIFSKLRQNPSVIQDIVRIQRVIWDHLLAFKGQIILKQALFSLPCRTPNNPRIVLIYAVCSVFSFVLFSTPPKSFFRLNLVKKAWNRCFHSRFSSEAIILGFVLPKRRLVLLWATVATSSNQAMMRGEKKIVINSGFLPFR